MLLLLLRKGLLQVFFSGCGRRSRHLKRWRCVHATRSTRTTTTRPTSTGRPLIIGRMRIIVDWFKRIDIWASAERRHARPCRRRRRLWEATTGFFFFRTPYDVYISLNHSPV
jgi:hypothetical protein